jgi:6-phosphogluconolactonase
MSKGTAKGTTVEVLPTADALASAAAERVVAAATHAIEADRRFIVALSGGSTPRATFELLARAPAISRIRWSHVHVVWGDERCVPPTDAESNYRMARETLLDHVPVPAANIHRIRGEDDPAVAAASYERELRVLLRTPDGAPSLDRGRRIDLALLGLGDNGHTASIFPNSKAIDEQTRWAMAERVDATPPLRVTLTAPLLNAAASVVFIVSGGGKAAVLKEVIDGPPRPRKLPAQLIVPVLGELHWLVDAAAGAQLGAAS